MEPLPANSLDANGSGDATPGSVLSADAAAGLVVAAGVVVVAGSGVAEANIDARFVAGRAGAAAGLAGGVAAGGFAAAAAGCGGGSLSGTPSKFSSADQLERTGLAVAAGVEVAAGWADSPAAADVAEGSAG